MGTKIVTHKQLADLAGVSRVHISMILSGKARPSPELAKTLEQITGISKESWVFPENGNPMVKHVH